MNVEIINTGSELLLGRVLNTHQQWLCRRLSDRGYVVSRQTTVPDTGLAIQQAVRESLLRGDIVLVTGGLGPTSDDLTRPLIADLLGRPLQMDPGVLEAIQQFYAVRGRRMPESTKVQALAPAGSLVLPNAHGTAPGLVFDGGPRPLLAENGKARLLVLLPGPPRELYPMFLQQVLPLLQTRYPVQHPYACQVLKTTGLGESVIEERIQGLIQPLVDCGLIVGYCARLGEVEVRLSAQGPEAEHWVSQGAECVRTQLKDHVFGEGDETMEAVIIRMLTERRRTLALAESCTGGYLSHRLTNIPGSSAVLMAGLVTYSNAAKERWLGVPSELIDDQGAVSEATARAMAEGARRREGVDYALAITGIAGPGGGTEAKPVGTVFIALAGAAGTQVQHQVNRWERESFKQVTTQQAMDLLRRELRQNR